MDKLEGVPGLSFAPINKPSICFDDPHLKRTRGGLLASHYSDGRKPNCPLLPLEMNYGGLRSAIHSNQIRETQSDDITKSRF